MGYPQYLHVKPIVPNIPKQAVPYKHPTSRESAPDPRHALSHGEKIDDVTEIRHVLVIKPKGTHKKKR